jgi:dipeptidyl aminopeptidase/acylaminoacyl peptidase
MYSVAFNYMFQNFAANDFVVLYLNPRGSTGYGTPSPAASTTTIRDPITTT